jgi:zinc transporter, ZIP family
MANFVELVILAAVMGLSIFLSMPIVLSKSMRSRTVVLLNAIAIGILVFLLADVFSDVAPIIYSNPSNAGYIAVPEYAIAFTIAAVACFLLLYFAEHRTPGKAASPYLTALIIALAIGFQNLTEGLVFGANWAAGAIGLVSVIFVGFFIQNVTEGFPITSPLLGRDERKLGLLTMFFLIGGLPTIFGGIVGYFYNNALLDVIFDALAIGAILYCILPMLRVAFRPDESPEATQLRQRILYLGVLVGFTVGFLTNSI